MTKDPSKELAKDLAESSAKAGRVAQDERFVDAAHDLGGGASAEHFANLVSTIVKARLPKAGGKLKKQKKAGAKKPKLIKLKYGR